MRVPSNLFDALGGAPSLTVLLLLIPGSAFFVFDTVFAFFGALLFNVLLYKKSPQLYTWCLRPPSQGDAHTGAECRVLTLNAFLRVVGVNHEHSDLKDERIEQLVAILPSFDVVLLQEAVSAASSRRSTIIKAAHRAGLVHTVLPPAAKALSRNMIDSGLMILSRFPIHKEGSLTFKAACYIDQICAKGALYAQVRMSPTHTLHVFNTHLQSFYSLKDHTAHDIQQQQLQQLTEFIHEQVGDNTAAVVVLGGDFNIPRAADCALVHVSGQAIIGADELLLGKTKESGLIEVCGPNPAPTMSVLFDRSSGKEVSTTHEMCSKCVETHKTQHLKSNRVFEFCMGIDRFFVTDTHRARERGFFMDDKPQVHRFVAHKCSVKASKPHAQCALQVSDHWGVSLNIRTKEVSQPSRNRSLHC
eukprot:TRINITY_DN13181_c0_g1_i3.p1 TRINITY_DN13181_c0_g1~~TRINITY_DN13181_c0_g1_i3.p1  ORF type:complete len:416 (+),score=73.94 TRINITY_DN13181_c0_g1_i3:188-1435(+)